MMMEGRLSPSSWVLFFSVLLLGLFVTRLNYVQTSEGDGHLIWNSNLGKKIICDGNLRTCCGFRRCHLVLVPAKLKRRRFLSTRLRYYHNSDASFQLERLLLCGDIESNPGPANDEVNRLYISSNSSNSTCGNLAFPFNAKGLRCCHLNVRSLPPHFDEVTTLIRFNKLDIFALSETWLNSTWNDLELNIDDYYLFRQVREMSASASTHYGGGVAVYTKSNLLCERITFDTDICLEHICLQVTQHQAGPKLLFMVVYRPPNSTTDFCHTLTRLIGYALSHYGEIIVAGDFNIDLLRKKKSNLSTIFSDAGFTQIIKTATRVTDNTSTLIDHIYTTHPNRIVQSFVPVYGISDHFPVCFVHKFRGAKSPKCEHDEISYRNLKKLNLDDFIHDLEYAPWSLLEVFDDVNEKLATWELIFNDVANCHMPIVKKRVKRKCLSPWMNKEIRHLIHLRDQFKSRVKSNILARSM